jgi:type I restriction enzyme R subunit
LKYKQHIDFAAYLQQNYTQAKLIIALIFRII